MLIKKVSAKSYNNYDYVYQITDLQYTIVCHPRKSLKLIVSIRDVYTTKNIHSKYVPVLISRIDLSFYNIPRYIFN